MRHPEHRYTDLRCRNIRWFTEAPDPIDEQNYIGDKIDLQVLAEVDGRFISGHWELSGTEWLTVVFIPDWLTKEIISADEIDFWCYVRAIV